MQARVVAAKHNPTSRPSHTARKQCSQRPQKPARVQQIGTATPFITILVCIHCHLSFAYELDLPISHQLPPTNTCLGTPV